MAQGSLSPEQKHVLGAVFHFLESATIYLGSVAPIADAVDEGMLELGEMCMKRLPLYFPELNGRSAGVMKRLPGRRSFTLLPETPSPTIEEIEEVAASFKEGLIGECERRVRRSDMAGALAAIQGKEYVDKFVYALQLRAGSQLDALKRPARARPIHIPENLAKKKGEEKPATQGSRTSLPAYL